MSVPRQILPRQFYLITRRCTQRQFLLRPDHATNNAFIYCLVLAAQRHGIDLLLAVAESNHHHTVIFDRDGQCPAFVEYFHKLFARSQNALRGRWENFWAAEEPCVTRLLDRTAVIEKLVYAATNPVKDGLIERIHHWPGVHTYASLVKARPIHARRPLHFFRNPGPMPEHVTLLPTLPAELGPRDEVIMELRARVRAVEVAMAEERRRSGKRVLGRRRVLAQPWQLSPKSTEPRRELRPRFAGTVENRVRALLEYRLFLDLYRHARRIWLAGMRGVFPRGTYWLARFARVTVAIDEPPLH